jgi:hypothetical protein
MTDDIEEIKAFFYSYARQVIQTVETKQKSGIKIVRNVPHIRYIVEFDFSTMDHRAVKAESVELPTIDERIENEILINSMDSKEYEDLKRKIYSIQGEGIALPIQKFLKEILWEFVFSDNFTLKIHEIVEKFVNDTVYENNKYQILVYITGLILDERSIQLLPNITIRNPTNEDFEKTVPNSSLIFRDSSPMNLLSSTTSIIEILIDVDNQKEIEDKINRILAGLRIFLGKPISPVFVQKNPFSVYKSQSMSLNCNMQVYSYAKLDLKFQTKLIQFFLEFEKKIEHAFDTNHIKIAYEKYSEALLSKDVTEKRIANAIMGLESLFFRSSGDRGEFDYRLRIRIAKYMSLFSLDPITVRETVKQAYRIRSVYAHGDVLSGKYLKGIKTNYGSLNKILEDILGYLQYSMISILVNDLWEKDKFVELIEDALIDEKGNLELKKRIVVSDYL